jgi:hypothetical protein
VGLQSSFCGACYTCHSVRKSAQDAWRSVRMHVITGPSYCQRLRELKNSYANTSKVFAYECTSRLDACQWRDQKHSKINPSLRYLRTQCPTIAQPSGRRMDPSYSRILQNSRIETCDVATCFVTNRKITGFPATTIAKRYHHYDITPCIRKQAQRIILLENLATLEE